MGRITWTAACGAALLLGSAAWAGDDAMGGPAPAAAPASGAAEDILVLKDGTEVHGRITAEDDAGYAVKVGGSLRMFEKSGVKEVRRGAIPAPGGAPGPADAPPAAPAPADPKADRKEKRRERRKGEGETMTAAPVLSEEGRTWARSCLDRLQSGDPAVQRSAAEALRALGPAALPVLREARDSADEAGRVRLDRVIGTLDRPDGKGPRPDPAKAPPTAAGRNPGLLERVKADLGLDEAKSRTVGLALLAFGRETRETLADARDGLVTYEDARTKVTGLRGKLREDLNTTLTEEQLGKLDGILDEAAQKMRGASGQKKDPPPAKPADTAR